MIKKFYENNLSWNDKITSIIGKRHSEIDPIILDRSPKLSFRDDGKIDIDLMITHNLKLEDINKGFDLMHAGESIRSVVVF